jgi:hypothetical protein
MSSSNGPAAPGGFVQIIEYRTAQPEQMKAILDRWANQIGDARTAQWYLTTADPDRPGTYLQLVGFPSREAASVNSGHPATAQFAAELRAMCHDEPTFRNLEVTDAARL